jgi:hypothetical protein
LECRQYEEPELPGNRALGQDVVDCFLTLIAKEAFLASFEVVVSPTITGPMSPSECQPKEDLDLERRSGLPDELVSLERSRPDMKETVSRFRRVGSVFSPSPYCPIWLIDELKVS